MAATNSIWIPTTGTGSTFTYVTTNSTSTNSSPPDPEFPDWADEGNVVIDNDDNDWLVVGQFVDEHGVLMLELESEEFGEKETVLGDVEAPW